MAEDRITLRAGRAELALALVGGESVAWRVDGRDYLWSGDPAHWNRCAPILFPVVGASAGGQVTVAGRAYPMAQHGFARDARFALVDEAADSARLRLVDGAGTRAHYPFAFQLDVVASLAQDAFALAFEVTNTGDAPLPYALGFHPAFPWPFADGERRAGGGYRVEFEAPERAVAPEVGPGGLLRREERPLPLEGATLPLDPDLFTEALVFLDARSRAMRFLAPSGRAIRLAAEDFPHLAVWTRPTAPFLSLECWTGHADWEGFSGELSERDSQRLLPSGAVGRHAVTVSLEG